MCGGSPDYVVGRSNGDIESVCLADSEFVRDMYDVRVLLDGIGVL